MNKTFKRLIATTFVTMMAAAIYIPAFAAEPHTTVLPEESIVGNFENVEIITMTLDEYYAMIAAENEAHTQIESAPSTRAMMQREVTYTSAPSKSYPKSTYSYNRTEKGTRWAGRLDLKQVYKLKDSNGNINAYSGKYVGIVFAQS